MRNKVHFKKATLLWRLDVNFVEIQQKSNVDLAPKRKLSDRMKSLQEKEEQWKNKGKGAANDSVQFTVAGRMAKKGPFLAASDVTIENRRS